jgi:hypothetical protein
MPLNTALRAGRAAWTTVGACVVMAAALASCTGGRATTVADGAASALTPAASTASAATASGLPPLTAASTPMASASKTRHPRRRPPRTQRSTSPPSATRTVIVTRTAPPPTPTPTKQAVNPNAFILPKVRSARFAGCTPGPSAGSYYWHDAIELVGGQNWSPSWGRMSGRFLDDGNLTNGNGVGVHSVDLLDPHGQQHILEFPPGMAFSVQFNEYC